MTRNETEGAAGAGRIVVVFGGTGFLGRRVCRRLLARGFRVRAASRHPGRAAEVLPRDAALEPVAADVRDASSVAAALEGAWGAVNAVSLYVERGGDTFASIHVEAAGRVAAQARETGLERLVQLSGVGADPASRSSYVRARGLGEKAVRDAFPSVAVARPSVMVGPGDGFLTALIDLLRRFPAMPLFGRGSTRLQPVHVEDSAAGLVRLLETEPPAKTPEFGGADRMTYAELVRLVARRIGRRPVLVPVPLALWSAGAWLAEFAPEPPITVNQIDLMRTDNVPASDAPGLPELGVTPRPLGDVLDEILADEAG